MATRRLEAHFVEFGGLAAEEAACAGRHFQPLTAKSGEVLMEAGSIPQYLYYVEEGLLRLMLRKEDGREHSLQFALEGWWLADFMPFFERYASALVIDALEDCSLRIVGRTEYETLFPACPAMEGYFRRLYQRTSAAAQRRAHIHELRSAAERYESFVSRHPGFVERVPQYMLASFLGMTPESLSRLRKRRTVCRT